LDVAEIFISYIADDRQWAFWIGQELEKMGHVPRVHEWELPHESEAASWMERRHAEADHILCIVSTAYRDSPHSDWEHRAAQRATETGRQYLALRVFVEPRASSNLAEGCALHGLSEDQARSMLREFVSRAAQSIEPASPSRSGNMKANIRLASADIRFPGTTSPVPPKPKLTLSIGVIGHRPDRLAHGDLDHINSEVERVIDLIVHEVDVVHRRYKEVFRDAKPQLCVVSALAEGADRIVAKAAIAKNFKLDVPIPFPEGEYLKDFLHEDDLQYENPARATAPTSIGSVAEFEALINHSATRALLQLPGNRVPGDAEKREANKAYEMAGLTVIGQSDILLTVWDGGISHGRGGTTDMLRQAVRRGVPIIAIDITGEETRVRWGNLLESPVPVPEPGELPSEPVERVLPRLIEEFLRPPAARGEHDALLSYLGDSEPKGIWRRVTGLFAYFFGTARDRAVHAAAIAGKYREIFESVPRDGKRSPSPVLLAEAFGWADVMAIHYAKIFRFAYIFNFTISAAAVVMALCSLISDGIWPPVLEFFLIGLVVINTAAGRRFGWHKRWMEAREVAERMRVALLFWILGTQPPAFFGEEPAWTGWYARAIIREQGMRGGRLDRDGMSAARAEMLHVLEDQHNYHHRNAQKVKRFEKWLERTGQVLFGLTALLALAHASGGIEHFIPKQPECEDDLGGDIVIMLSAVLPTLATATYGIRLIGDFEGIAKRSERAEAGHWRVIEALRRDPADLILFRARAQIVSDAMLGDVSSWRLSAESRGLAVPG
jgi:TIR domain/Protein of unknown function (DUF4231)